MILIVISKSFVTPQAFSLS